MEDRLKGKVIIVAGGAGGIGTGLSLRYAAEGASVLVGDMDGAAAEAVAEEIKAAGGTAIAVQLEGSGDDSVGAAVELAVSTFGGLDGLHANFAGYNEGDDNDILGLPMADFDKVFSVNARGFVLCTRHALPHLLARGGGSLVYTSSAAAYLGEPVRLGYGMSKAALHALMRHVARRFGPQGIRANVIAPGVVLHPKLEEMLPAETVQGFYDVTLLKTRLGRPSDIAAMGALLMADEGAFITGQIMSVDGGAIMRP